jgi:hypothetical protein
MSRYMHGFGWPGGTTYYVWMDFNTNEAHLGTSSVDLTNKYGFCSSMTFHTLPGNPPLFAACKALYEVRKLLPGAAVTNATWWKNEIFGVVSVLPIPQIPEIPDIPQIPEIKIPDIPEIPDLTIGINKLIENIRSLINSTLKNILLIIVITILYQIFKKYIK